MSYPQAGATTAPRSAGLDGALLPLANFAAWEPAELPDLRYRPLQPAFARLHTVLWEAHLNQVQALAWRDGPSAFLSWGYTRGMVSDDFLAEMASVFRGEPFRFDPNDFRADGLHTSFAPGDASDLIANLAYFAPDRVQRTAISGFLAGISDQVAQELRTPWRVLNIRCYRTARRFRSGPQLWHRDGFPAAILKLLVYLCPDGGPVEGSELIDHLGQEVKVLGPSGTWLLFDPNVLLHRGPTDRTQAGGGQPRCIIEVVLCRDLETVLEYRFGGSNYRHPLCPPGIDLFGETAPVECQPLTQAVIEAARAISALSRAGP